MNSPLTNQQMIDELRLRLDEAHNPGWEDAQLATFINNAIYEWVSEKYNNAEANERSRNELSYLTRRKNVTLSNKVFTLEGLFILAVEAEFNFECAGKVSQRTVPVRPLKFDTDYLDPYSWGGSDYFPGYQVYAEINGEETQRKAKFLSTTAPQNVLVTYLDEAGILQVEDEEVKNLDKNIGLPRLYQLQILDRAVRTISEVAENAFRTQMQASLEIPAKS